MLKIVDKDGRTKFILKDEDEEPLSIDELILEDENKNEKGEENANEN